MHELCTYVQGWKGAMLQLGSAKALNMKAYAEKTRTAFTSDPPGLPKLRYKVGDIIQDQQTFTRMRAR